MGSAPDCVTRLFARQDATLCKDFNETHTANNRDLAILT